MPSESICFFWRIWTLTLASAACLSLIVQHAFADENACDRSEALLSTLSETYGIDIVHPPARFSGQTEFGWIRGEAATTDDLARYVPLFAREFSLYPAQLVKKSKLARVVLCRNLSFRGKNQAATADCLRATLYFDASLAQAETARYACVAVHHEFFHQLDFADDGDVSQDAEWSSLNPAGFVYGQEPRKGATATAEFTQSLPGFLTQYSLTAVEEEKADIFAYSIVNGSYVESRAKGDAILTAKMRLMKRRLAAFCAAMDESFWASTKVTSRPGPEPQMDFDGDAHAEEDVGVGNDEVENSSRRRESDHRLQRAGADPTISEREIDDARLDARRAAAVGD